MTHRYITTAIPYANAKPHIGNALDYLYADIWARYCRGRGDDVRFQMGTDEHGNKVSARADDAGLGQQEFVDQMSPHFQALADAMNISYTDFIRTTNSQHKSAVQEIWRRLTPYIYKHSYEGWYCTGCENFVTDNEAEANGGTCPDHQRAYEHLSEENYYLRASEFTDRIRAAIESGEVTIVPEFRKKEFLNLIADGVRDVSISRPRKSLSWGVEVPGDDGQVMYVWMDALCNYITVLGYPDTDISDWWPADVMVVGKDILRFHAGVLPAILLGLGLPLPKHLLVHGHVNVDGQKMSKSLGNVIDPMQVIADYGAEALRYYASRHVPTLDDGDFTLAKCETAYNSELGNDLGNLVQRVSAMSMRYIGGKIGEIDLTSIDTQRYTTAMEAFEFNLAIDEVWTHVRALNGYLEHTKPWEVARDKENPETQDHLRQILTHCASELCQIATLLAPFMPDTAAKITAIFGGGEVVPADGPLFPKLYIVTEDPRAPK